MAHEIDQTVNAQGACVFAREAAWHGLGTVLDHPFTSQEALAIAGLDFDVEKRPLFCSSEPLSSLTPGVYPSSFQTLTEFVATVRNDTHAPLGVVGPDYEVLQNREAFKAFDSVLQTHGAVYETAGALRGGKRIFISAKLPESFKVTDAPGDAIEEYLLLFNAHDGSAAVWMVPTAIRPVCANTVGAALGLGFKVARQKLAQGRALKVRHTASATERLLDAGKVFEAAHARTLKAVENAKLLASLPAGDQQVEEAVKLTLDFFIGTEPRTVVGQRASGKVLLDAIVGKQAKLDEKRSIAGAAILAQIEAEFDLVGKNLWAVWNGATEYADHSLIYRGANATENRFNSIISGRVDDYKGLLANVLAPAAA